MVLDLTVSGEPSPPSLLCLCLGRSQADRAGGELVVIKYRKYKVRGFLPSKHNLNIMNQ